MPILYPHRNITIQDGVDGTVYAADIALYYYLSGTATLTGDWNLDFSGTPRQGMTCMIKYNGTVTLDGNSIVIFGSTMPSDYASISVLITAFYTGSAWAINFMPTGSASSIISESNIKDDAVTTSKINDLAVTTGKLNDLAVTAAKLAANSVETLKIKNLNVTGAKIAAGTITLDKLASDSIDENKIVSTAFGNGLSGGSGTKPVVVARASGGLAVDASGVYADADSSSITISVAGKIQIGALGVQESHVSADAITSTKIKDGEVTNAKLAGSIALNKLASTTASRVLVTDALGFPSASSVTSTTLGYLDATSSIQTQINAKLTEVLTSTYLFVGSSGNVATARNITGDVAISNTGVVSISSGVIVNADVNASAAISFSKLQSLATGSIMVGSAGTPVSVSLGGDATIAADGTLTIANDAITTVKILDANVTEGKIAALAVTAGKIGAGAVTTAKIGAGAVENLNIASGTIAPSRLTSDAKTEMLTTYASFETGYTGSQRIRIPFKCSVVAISAGVIKDIDAAANGEITFADNAGSYMSGGSLSSGKLTISMGDSIGTQTETEVTGNNDIAAGDDIRVTTGNATSGTCLVIITLQRAD